MTSKKFALIDNDLVVQVISAEALTIDGHTVPAITCRDRLMPEKPADAGDDWVMPPLEEWQEADAVLRPLYPAEMDWRPATAGVEQGWSVNKGGTFNPPSPRDVPAHPKEDPVVKLAAFLSANPDVAALIAPAKD